jgi:hypothetical protein
MTRRQRLRRVAILCCHCLRNLAFYRAWHQAGRPRSAEQFWVTANGNFLDIAVLEWCKLFADVRGKHHWAKVVSDVAVFKVGLLQHLAITDTVLDGYIIEMRTYRDKFIAHLDDELQMQIPHLTVARKSAVYLYGYLHTNEDDDNTFPDAPTDIAAFYRRFLAEARVIYAQ